MEALSSIALPLYVFTCNGGQARTLCLALLPFFLRRSFGFSIFQRSSSDLFAYLPPAGVHPLSASLLLLLALGRFGIVLACLESTHSQAVFLFGLQTYHGMLVTRQREVYDLYSCVSANSANAQRRRFGRNPYTRRDPCIP